MAAAALSVVSSVVYLGSWVIGGSSSSTTTSSVTAPLDPRLVRAGIITMIQIATLAQKPVGTKIGFGENALCFYEPGWVASAQRTGANLLSSTITGQETGATHDAFVQMKKELKKIGFIFNTFHTDQETVDAVKKIANTAIEGLNTLKTAYEGQSAKLECIKGLIKILNKYNDSATGASKKCTETSELKELDRAQLNLFDSTELKTISKNLKKDMRTVNSLTDAGIEQWKSKVTEVFQQVFV